ncbi:hypothetical protein BKA69DRAFT_1068890 [Paraphysoderma sedebokerense]|nr:hypothetical protein BKA69DRAFT_1068890 [Paraphysoderma sedebokerense]
MVDKGKSTATELLVQLLKPVKSFILRQDSFFKPSSSVPVDPVTAQQSWDVPDALDIPSFISTLQQIRSIHSLNSLSKLFKERRLGQDGQESVRKKRNIEGEVEKVLKKMNVDVGKGLLESVNRIMRNSGDEGEERELVVVIVDGFLMFQDYEILRNLDVRVFLKACYEVCKRRRGCRTGYDCCDGEFWADPPTYFDDVVWPAYLKYNDTILSLSSLSPALPPSSSNSPCRAYCPPILQEFHKQFGNGNDNARIVNYPSPSTSPPNTSSHETSNSQDLNVLVIDSNGPPESELAGLSDEDRNRLIEQSVGIVVGTIYHWVVERIVEISKTRNTGCQNGGVGNAR